MHTSAIRNLPKQQVTLKLSDAPSLQVKPSKAGDKVYANIRGKSVIFVQIGTKSLEEGLNILGAHIDSPRLDVKQNPRGAQ